MTVLLGLTVTLRPATPADALALATIRATAEVQERWGGADELAPRDSVASFGGASRSMGATTRPIAADE